MPSSQPSQLRVQKDDFEELQRQLNYIIADLYAWIGELRGTEGFKHSEDSSETFITADGVTYENLNTNGDVGTAADQVAQGSRGVTNGDSHDHVGGDGAAIAEAALTLSDNTTADVSTAKHGFTPKAPNDTTKFLRGDASYAVPDHGSLGGLTDDDHTIYAKAAATRYNYSPSSVTVNTGTGSGVVANVSDMFEGDTYDVAEAASTPGFDVEFAFSSITVLPRKLVIRAWYNGTSTHGVGIDIYNYDTTAWDRFHSFLGDHLDYVQFCIDIPSATNYVDGSGNAKIRFYHFSAGNASHDIYIDYIQLAST